MALEYGRGGSRTRLTVWSKATTLLELEGACAVIIVRRVTTTTGLSLLLSATRQLLSLHYLWRALSSARPCTYQVSVSEAVAGLIYRTPQNNDTCQIRVRSARHPRHSISDKNSLLVVLSYQIRRPRLLKLLAMDALQEVRGIRFCFWG